MQRLPWILSGIAILGMGALLIWRVAEQPVRRASAPIVSENEPPASSPEVEQERTNRADWVKVGGVDRPKTDVNLGASSGEQAFVPPKPAQGFSPRLAPDANPQVAAIHQLITGGGDTAAISSFAEPAAFDADAYRQDPQAYLSRVEPSRVFAPAQPGEGVSPILAISDRFHRVKQGESVRLRVKVLPGSPVTLTSTNLGQFENQLTSITVAADQEGIAEAVFTASRGTIDDIPILAASPETSGQVTFTVNVQVPSGS